MFPSLFYPASTDLWWPGHVLLIHQFKKYLLSIYMVPEFMYHTGHQILGSSFGKRQNLNAYMRGKKWKENTASLASCLKNSWNSRSALTRSDRLRTQGPIWDCDWDALGLWLSGKGWTFFFFYHKHTSFPNALSLKAADRALAKDHPPLGW